MRLAVVIGQPFWFDGTRYSTNAPFIDFVMSFKERAKQLLLFVPVLQSSHEKGAFTVEADSRVRIVHLPFFKTATEMYLFAYRLVPEMKKIFRRELSSWDIAWLVGSHLPSMLLHNIACQEGKRTFLYVRSDIAKEINSHRYSGLKGVMATAIVLMAERKLEKALRQGTPAFVTGKELLTRYARVSPFLFPVYPTLVTENDILKEKEKDRGDVFSVIAVGRLTPEKGLDILVDAISILVNDGLLITCQFVGAGKDEVNIRNRVRKLGLEQYVQFAGFIPPGKELYKRYDTADIYVLSSYTEGLPKTLYEAMARGLPVVSTDVGGISEIVIDGKNGLLVSSGDPVALAGAIRRLAGDAELRHACSAANLERVKEFTLERQRDRMFAIIQNNILVGQRGTVQC